MRILHTSDWHLGRVFHGIHLTADQAHVLEQLCRLARDAKVDAVIVSGDIYDRQVPPSDAVALLDDTLARLALDVGVPVLVIAGNHDSPERLGFGARLLQAGRLHVAGGLSREPRPVVLRDAHGPVEFFLLPYAEPAFARGVLEDAAVVDHETAFRSIVGRLRPGPRSVLVAHAFVSGGQVSPDSERPLSVGGAGTVDASVFRGFSYAALGHLHRPQAVGDGPLRYSGSLLKYSVDEESHRKSVAIVDLDAAGRCRVEEVALAPRRDVRHVEGTLDEILKRAGSDPAREDYVEAWIRGREALLDLDGRLRRFYPNLIGCRRPDLEQAGVLASERLDLARITEADLFASYFEQVTGSPLTAEEHAALRSVLESLRQDEVTA